MATVVQDLRFGARMMAKTPVVTAVAVLSLALGIAANAAMFAVLDSFLFEPLPYAEPDRLVLFRTLRQGQSMDFAGGVSVPNFRDYSAASEGIESSMLYTTELQNLTGLDVPEQLSVIVATPSVFDVLGVQPLLGRGFRPEEGADGSGRVLVLDYEFWQRRFLGETEALGRRVMLDGEPHTVVGVMPEGFDMLPANVQAYRPSDFDGQVDNRGSRGFIAFARLGPGATAGQVGLELEGLFQRLAAEFPEANRGIDLVVQSLRDFFPGPTDTQLVRILTVVTLFGLLIACANVANLLLSRAEERQKEVAVRTALGAGRRTMLRQLLTESALMALLAGALGVTLAVWVVRWLQGVIPPDLPAALIPRLGPGVLLATLLVSLLAAVAFGLAPALHAVSGNLREGLGNGARGATAGRGRRRLRNAFVVGEVAVALALLTGAGFLIQAFGEVSGSDPGFDQESLLTFRLTVLEDRYPEDADLREYERELIRVLAGIPSVESVAVMSSLPRGRKNPSRRYTVDGRPVPELQEQPTAGYQAVNPEYFSTMQIPLVSGRLFAEVDRADAPPVILVSEALAGREFPVEEPLGRMLTVGGEARQIVGVVGDILQERIALAGEASQMIYVPIAQVPLRNPSFALRSRGDPTALAADVREAVWSVESDQPVAQVRTLEAHMDESLASIEAISVFLTALGGIALALAAMGIYGVLAHSVTQQQREIGVRLALGAGRGEVVGLVTRSGLGLVTVGVLMGLPLAYLMFRAAGAMLGLFTSELGWGYPLSLSAALLAVAATATVFPAWRASAIPPVSALKE